jgi:membrane protease YdiL (CAAX protease family)
MNARLLLVLGLVCACSLGLITVVDEAVAFFIGLVAPSLAWIAWIRIPSLIVCALLFVLTNPGDAWRLSRKGLSWSVLRVALCWLIPAAYAVLVARVWVPALPRWIDVVAFLVTGLLAEELLFRGAIFNLANRILAEKPRAAAWSSVLVSSVFFALQHLQYHGFQWTPAATVQVGYTFVMGVCFGVVRQRSESVWAAIAVHFINNLFVVLRQAGL